MGARRTGGGARVAEKTDVPRTVALSVMGSVLAGFLVQILSKVLLPDLTGVLSLTALIYISALLMLATGFAIYYLRVLGSSAAAPESPERESYERLEARLLTGGTPNKVYNDILARALDAVDRFFGDPNRADVSWFTRATGWDAKGARWTAPACNRGKFPGKGRHPHEGAVRTRVGWVGILGPGIPSRSPMKWKKETPSFLQVL
jgi:hypothetical protein